MGVLVIHVLPKKILAEDLIRKLGQELYDLADNTTAHKVIVSLHDVEFVSSAMLQKWIITDKKLKRGGISWAFCHKRPEIYEVFVITRLNVIFSIADNKDEVLEMLR